MLTKKEMNKLKSILLKSRKGTIVSINHYTEEIGQYISNYREYNQLPPFKWLRRMIKIYNKLIQK